MRFLITSTESQGESDKSNQPMDEALMTAYMKYNEEMARAGVLVASEGLLPEGARARVVVSSGKRKAVDGPFAESKELIGGFYVLEVASREEAIEWALKCPVGMASADVLDLYQMTGPSDLPQEVRDIIRRAAPTWSASFEGSKVP